MSSPSEGRFAARDSVALGVGTIINGLLAYAFFALVTQRLGAERSAPVAVLWTYWGVCTAIVMFPVQHWIIRTLRARGEGPVRASLPRLVWYVGLSSVVAGIAAWLVRGQLFSTDTVVFPVLVAILTVVTLFGGIVRGGLAGRESFIATGVVLAGENLLRLSLAVAVLMVGGEAAAVGVVLVVGGLLGLGWPSSYRFVEDGDQDGREPFGAFLGDIAVGSLIGQLVLVGGPGVLALMGGDPASVTSLFVTLALFRAPYLLSLGLANQATGALTGLVVSHSARTVRRLVRWVASSTVVGSILAGWFGLVAGAQIVGLVFGTGSAPLPTVAALVAAGSAIAVGNLALSLLVIARGAKGKLTGAWVVALFVVGGVLLIAPTSLLSTRGAWAFLAGELAAFLILLAGSRNSANGRSVDVVHAEQH